MNATPLDIRKVHARCTFIYQPIATKLWVGTPLSSTSLLTAVTRRRRPVPAARPRQGHVVRRQGVCPQVGLVREPAEADGTLRLAAVPGAVVGEPLGAAQPLPTARLWTPETCREQRGEVSSHGGWHGTRLHVQIKTDV